MSYNGIGLQTPRGSGTSGHIQKNLADKKSEGFRQKRDREAFEEERRAVKARQNENRKGADVEIRDHDRKRWIEVQCMELRDKLEDTEMEDDEIDEKVAQLRKKLTEKGDKAEKKEVVSSQVEITEKIIEKAAEAGFRKEGVTDNGEEAPKTGEEAPKETANKSPYSYVPRYSNR